MKRLILALAILAIAGHVARAFDDTITNNIPDYAYVPALTEDAGTTGLDTNLAYVALPLTWFEPFLTASTASNGVTGSYRTLVFAFNKAAYDRYVDLGDDVPQRHSVNESVNASSEGWIRFSHRVQTDVNITGLGVVAETTTTSTTSTTTTSSSTTTAP
jgi:hypothetical protein